MLTRQLVPMEYVWGTADPNGPGPRAAGTKSPAQAVVRAFGVRAGDGRSQTPCPSIGGTGSPAQASVGTYGAPTGDGSSQRPGPTTLGDAESFPGGGPCLWRACRGRQFATARGHELGGQGVLPRWRLVPMECLRVTTDPNGPGPPAGGTGSHAHVALSAFGGPVGDGTSQRQGPSSWGEGESCPDGGWCLLRACAEHSFPNGPGPPAGRTGSPAQAAVGACGGAVGDGSSQRPGATSCGHGESCQGGAWCLWRACGGRQFLTARAH